MKKEKVKKSDLGFITILLILIVVFILNFILWEIYPKEIETIKGLNTDKYEPDIYEVGYNQARKDISKLLEDLINK